MLKMETTVRIFPYSFRNSKYYIGGNMRKNIVTQVELGLCNKFNIDILNEFLENSMQLSDKTKISYRSCLYSWFNWVRLNADNKRHVDLKSIDLLKYQNFLAKNEHSSSDIATKRYAISSLNLYILTYYEEEYKNFRNFVHKGVAKPEHSLKNEKLPPTRAELNMILDNLEERGELQKIAYLKFCYETGCRREEARQILKDVVNAKQNIKDMSGSEIHYYYTHDVRCKGRGKTGKIRKFIFTDYSMDAFKAWAESRDDDCEYMFITSHNGKVVQAGETAFNYWATNDFSKILGRRFHPHIMREAAATIRSVEDGKSDKSIQSLLGHKDQSTTQLYIIRPNEDEDVYEIYT